MQEKGFTIIEIVVSIMIIAILFSSIYGIYTAIVKGIAYYRDKTTVSSLADQYMEIARNLPYSKVGTLSGSPSGSLPDCPDLTCRDPSPSSCCANAKRVTFNGTTYIIYYVVNAQHDSADSNSTVQDYKQVKLYIKNTNTGQTNSFLTTVAPISLAQLGNGGALSISVISSKDNNNQPIPGAIIHITNTNLSPNSNIDLTRTTDSNGNWTEVGLPPSSNSYHISVTKLGYSTDQTYSELTYPSAGDRNDSTVIGPPPATVIPQITSIGFVIDKLSTLVIKTDDKYCNVVPNVNLALKGLNVIPGYDSDFQYNSTLNSGAAGQVVLNNMSYGTYIPTVTDADKMIYSTSPVQDIYLPPGTTNTFTFIVGPTTDTQNNLLVMVKDSGGAPIQDATVELDRNGVQIGSLTTGGSAWTQQDWSSGSGQQDFSSDPKGYFSGTGINYNNPSGISLMTGQTDGWLESSTYQVPDATSYTQLLWHGSQPAGTSVKFQIATSDTDDENTVWTFNGPSGTASDYYSTPPEAINSDNKKYIRYEAFLHSADNTVTPILSNVSVNYNSPSCPYPGPGQALFPDLTAGSDYSLTVSKLGYQSKTDSNLNINGYQTDDIQLNTVP